MKVLVFALSTVAYGDTLVGIGLTNQLRAAGVRSHYVITASSENLLRHHGYPHTVLDPAGGQDVRAEVDAVVRRFRPDAIVLADYLNHWGTLIRQFDTDPWFIDDYRLPVLPIDIWEWENTAFRFDVCGRRHEREVSRRILDMPAHLRPVPVCHLDPGPAGYGHPYRVLPPEPALTAARRREVRAALGVGERHRLVMLPMAAWQHQRGDRPGMTEMVGRLGRRVPELLADYLRRLPSDAHLLFIGGNVPEPFLALPAERVHLLPLCAPDRYDELLASVDAVLSLTTTGLTVSRAILADTPAMLLTNRFTVPDTAAVDTVESELGGMDPVVRRWLLDTAPVEPFRMWPKGQHAFLEPLLKDNPHLDALVHRELFDGGGVVAALTALLFDPGTRDDLAARRAGYAAAVAALPPTEEVFAAAAGRAALAVR
ncbi:hypothetical protein UO65_1337 [Actinokineospora spheciospongiae]|uniref:Glycosyltransferase n=1 Tax=Actinokineospora spheciospongiae TaxID=909613 RepID=W7JB98_9PSEU|nr:DUF6365 family protein [Actinokineospora spheciospongiae]EWC63339.1 hypothetical protein UO65_1337 [Actinokineospora spheciospongiae]